MANIEFEESWENLGLEDIENIIKDKVAELEGGVHEILKISLPEGAIKYFSTTSSEVKIKLTLDHKYGDEYDATDVSFGFEIGGSIYPINLESIPSSEQEEVYTENIIDLLNTVSGDQIYGNLIVSSPQKEFSRRLTFNRREGSIVFTSKLGDTNPTYLTVSASFKGNRATIKSFIYGTRDSADAAIKTALPDIVITDGGSKQIPIPQSGLTYGSHKVEAYLLLDDGQTETLPTFSYIFITSASNRCYIANTELINPIQYSTEDIRFTVYDSSRGLTDTINVKFSRRLEGSTYEDIETKSITNGTPFILNYYIRDINNIIKIEVLNTLSSDSITTYVFNAVPNEVNWEPKANPEFYLSARNKNNTSDTKNVWTDNNYSVLFENVQFSDIGSGWRQNYLHLLGNSKIKILKNNQPFYPFYNTTEPIEGSKGGGLLANGFTLKIRLRVPRVSDSNVKIVQAYDESTNIGFYLTGEDIFIAFKENLISDPSESQGVSGHNSRKFSDNIIFDLIITGQPYYDINGNETDHIVSYYINGEIAGFLKLLSSDKTLSQANSTKQQLVFGSVGAEVDIFDIRYYNSYCTPFEAVQTHTMDLDNVNEIRAAYDKNNFYDLDDLGEVYLTPAKAIQYGKYLATKGKTDFAVVLTTDLCNNTHAFYNISNPNQREINHDGNFIGSTSHTNDFDPQSYYLYRFKQDDQGNGIIDPDLSLWYEATEGGALRFRRQGTSTKDSTKGNVRIDNRKNIIIHTFNASTQKFNAEGETVAGKSSIWHIPNDDSISCELLTMKKNPNDSTQARNLPTAKLYEDGARFLASYNTGTNSEPRYDYEDLLTPPQREELREIESNYPQLTKIQQIDKIKTRQCIDGIPSIVFEMRRLDSNNNDRLDPTVLFRKTEVGFGGQFDLITDKSNMDVFGFNNPGTFSVEFRQNTSSLCTFHTSDITDYGTKRPDGTEGRSHLEYRYPVDEDCIGGDYSPSLEHPNGKATIGMGYGEPMQLLFDFVASCSPVDNAIGYRWENGQKLSNVGYITINGDVVEDTIPNRKLKFKAEIGNYIVLHQFIYNGIMVDVGLMCDQVVKNQFWTYFENVSNYDKKGAHKLLRLLGYDFDSSWGVDNDNFFRFKHNVLWEDGLYDGNGEGADAGRNSDFWTLMFDCFKDEFSSMARVLRSGGYLTSNSILKYMHDNQVDVYNAIIYNANSEYSYLEGRVDYPKAHGSAKEHTEWFVKGRLHFISGKLCNQGGDGSEFASDKALFTVGNYTELDNPNKFNNQITITATVYQRTYIGLGQQNELADSKTYLVEENDNVIITFSGAHSRPDYRPFILGSKYIKTLKGIEKMYIQQIADWGNLTNVEELTLGYYGLVGVEGSEGDYNNPFIENLNISDNITFGNCKKLITAGCSKIVNLSLTAFPVLEYFDGRNMTSLRNFTLPLGNTVKTLHLPANLSNLNLVDRTAITTFSIQSVENTNIVCTGCRNIVSTTILDSIISGTYTGSSVILQLGRNSGEPVIFDNTRLNWLLDIINSNSNVFTLSGYINTESGMLRRDYIQKINNKFPNLNILAESVEVNYELNITDQAIIEGGNSSLVVWGSDRVVLNDIILQITHDIQNHTGGTLTNDQIAAKFHLNKNTGVITIDSPNENDTWFDAINIKHRLNYENTWRENELTLVVSAVGISSTNSSFTYTGGTTVASNGSIDIVVNIGQSCTKQIELNSSQALQGTATYGSFKAINKTTIRYTAPQNPGTDNVTIRFRPYSNTSEGIALTSIQTITVIAPQAYISILKDGLIDSVTTIKLRNLTTQEESLPLNNSDTYNTVTDTQYQILYEVPDGYRGVLKLNNTPMSTDTFTATNSIINISLEMEIIPPRIVGIYSDGTEEEADVILDRGSFADGKTIVAVGIDIEQARFCVSINANSDIVTGFIHVYMNTSVLNSPKVYPSDIYFDYNGYIKTQQIRFHDRQDPNLKVVKQHNITINNIIYNGYIPAYGELTLLFNNITTINKLIRLYNPTEIIVLNVFVSSSAYSSSLSGDRYDYCWVITPNGPSQISVETNTSTLPFYKF